MRSRMVVRILKKNGVDVVNIKGGMFKYYIRGWFYEENSSYRWCSWWYEFCNKILEIKLDRWNYYIWKGFICIFC